MAVWKNPPKEKVYEALSAVGAGRVTLLDGLKAAVLSSDSAKTYTVEWSEDVKGFTSNDNASYWQGYMGYPIIAVLMVLGKLNYSADTAVLLASVQWKELNKRFRNDYSKAVAYALNSLGLDSEARQAINDDVDRILTQIETRELEKLPRGRRPPK
jgi:hypothetical protein